MVGPYCFTWVAATVLDVSYIGEKMSGLSQSTLRVYKSYSLITFIILGAHRPKGKYQK